MTTQAAPSRERIAELTLLALNRTLAEVARNGQQPGADLRWMVDAWAQVAPEVAARLPYVRAALTPQVRAEVFRLISAPPASKVDAAPAQQAQSVVSAKEAADLLGISPQAVRFAAAQGRLTASKHRVTGEWRINRAAAESYRRQRGAERV